MGDTHLWGAIHHFRGAIHLGVAFFPKYIPEKAFDLGYKKLSFHREYIAWLVCARGVARNLRKVRLALEN